MRLERIECKEAITLDVIACAREPQLVDAAIAAVTVDLSADGMKVTSTKGLPVKTIIGLTLEVAERTFRLEGEVRWCRGGGRSFAGVRLSDGRGDFSSWADSFRDGLLR